MEPVITNGHDFHSLNKALTKKFKNNYPTVIIAIQSKAKVFLSWKIRLSGITKPKPTPV